MSTHQPPSVAKWRYAVRDSDMIPNRKFVLLVLSTYMNENGRCWPSLTRLAKITGLHKSTIIRNLNAAEDDGWITRKPGGADLITGKNFATEYTALTPGGVVAGGSRTYPAEDPPKVSTTTSVLGRVCDPNKKNQDLNLSQVLGVAPKSSATPTDDLEKEVEGDEQKRTQELAPIEEAPIPSVSNHSGDSPEPFSSDADFDSHEKAAPPPGGMDAWKEDWRRRLEKVPA